MSLSSATWTSPPNPSFLSSFAPIETRTPATSLPASQLVTSHPLKMASPTATDHTQTATLISITFHGGIPLSPSLPPTSHHTPTVHTSKTPTPILVAPEHQFPAVVKQHWDMIPEHRSTPCNQTPPSSATSTNDCSTPPSKLTPKLAAREPQSAPLPLLKVAINRSPTTSAAAHTFYTPITMLNAMIGDIHAPIMRMLCKVCDDKNILRLCPRDGGSRLAWRALKGWRPT
jgi:hypothetical protein